VLGLNLTASLVWRLIVKQLNGKMAEVLRFNKKP